VLTNEFHLLAALTAVLTGLGIFLLCLVVQDLIGAAALRVWQAVSPGAARQARFRATMAAYQGSFAKRGTPIGHRQ
jgi:hypothetical protein